MRYAVVQNDMVVTVIIANEDQKEIFESALQANLVDASEYKLAIGDLWNGKAWTRNMDGEQKVLKPFVPIEDRIVAMEKNLAESDEIAIELYEANLAQETINTEQDEAIIEIYEKLEGTNNG